MEFSSLHELIAGLRDKDPARREEAVLALGCMEDPSLLPHVQDMLQDPSHRVRWRALQSLAKLGPTESSDRVLKLARDSSALVRAEAARILGLMGNKASAQALSELFQDEDLQVRCRAIEAIGELRANEERFMEPLIRLLREEESGIRMNAAISLGACRYAPALSHLVDCLKDPVRNVRGFAAWAIGRIGDPKGLDPLIIALDDEGEHVRVFAYQAIAQFGKRALPGLEKALAASTGNAKMLKALREEIQTDGDAA